MRDPNALPIMLSDTELGDFEGTPEELDELIDFVTEGHDDEEDEDE